MEQVRRSLFKGSGKGADHAGKGAEDGGKGAAAKASAKAAAAKAAAAKAHAGAVAYSGLWASGPAGKGGERVTFCCQGQRASGSWRVEALLRHPLTGNCLE